MSGYIKRVLHKFQHKFPTRFQHALHKWMKLVYGKIRQYTIEKDNDLILTADETKTIQQIVGNLLYYARAIKSPMLSGLNEIQHRQASPTKNTLEICYMILDFCASHPNGKIRYYASDMILQIDTDAAYLVLPGAKSRITGYYFLSQHPPAHGIPQPVLNGAIHVEFKALKCVLASAAESETGGIFVNAQFAIPIRHTLIALEHLQPLTQMKTDNSTAYKFVHNDMKQKMSESWDMRYNWLRDHRKVGLNGSHLYNSS